MKFYVELENANTLIYDVSQVPSYMHILRDLAYQIVERHHSKWVESKTWLVGSAAAIRASLHVIHVYQGFNLKLKE